MNDPTAQGLRGHLVASGLAKSYPGPGGVPIAVLAGYSLDREALPEGNAAAVLSFIEQVAEPADVAQALARLFGTLPDAEDRSLGEVLSGWLRAVVGRVGEIEPEEFDEMMQRTSTGRLRGTSPPRRSSDGSTAFRSSGKSPVTVCSTSASGSFRSRVRQ